MREEGFRAKREGKRSDRDDYSSSVTMLLRKLLSDLRKFFPLFSLGRFFLLLLFFFLFLLLLGSGFLVLGDLRIYLFGSCDVRFPELRSAQPRDRL